MHPNEKQFKYRKKTLGLILRNASYVFFSCFHGLCIMRQDEK